MQKLVHPKDVMLDIERSNVLYHVPYVDCHATYVGERKRKLGKRMDEYRRAVQRVEVEVSALAEHVWKSDHKVDWGHVAILDCNSNLHEWLTLVACHISRQSLPLNRDRGMLLNSGSVSTFPSLRFFSATILVRNFTPSLFL